MIWPLRALLGPGLWAVAFGGIYAVHGYSCAMGWPGNAAPIGDLHHFVLITLWLLALGAAGVNLLLAPRGCGTVTRLIGAGAWIGFGGILLTLFPVLGLSSC